LNSEINIVTTFHPQSNTVAYLKGWHNSLEFQGVNQFKYDQMNNDLTFHGPDYGLGIESILPTQVAKILSNRIYMFKAERANLSQSEIASHAHLKSDASNLAGVINYLRSSNETATTRYNEYITEIFPSIKQVTAPSIGENKAEIKIWTEDLDLEREDLAISLADSGTGVGQVLAIIFVIVTSKSPRTIIIDEPQSFLHPGAIRKLIEILKQHPQHQYILTTHSPTVITACNPQTILLVKKEGSESTIEPIDVTETTNQRYFLSEIGASLSDVFGADNILWVEGPTEEESFRLIVSGILKRPLMGTAILKVTSTGDFDGKHSDKVIDIYNRLSTGRGLIPPAIGFIFDREKRTQQQIDDLTRQSKGAVQYLSRRMYENYLLNPSAIAGLISGLENFREQPVTVEEIEQYLKNEFNKLSGNQEERLKIIDGAKVLDMMFNELSETRHNYEDYKVKYGVTLTEWLIKNSPEDLQEVAELLKTVLDKNKENPN